MTETYVAPTNGHEITDTGEGGLRIALPGSEWVTGRGPITLVKGRVQSLREFFRDERDKEMRRWRDPKHPDLFVKEYDTIGVVTVTDERNDERYAYYRDEEYSRSDEPGAVAQAYFEAHPVKKPWHDTLPGDVWVITTTLHREEFSVHVNTEGELQSASGFCYSPTDTSILSGRRIWERI